MLLMKTFMLSALHIVLRATQRRQSWRRREGRGRRVSANAALSSSLIRFRLTQLRARGEIRSHGGRAESAEGSCTRSHACGRCGSLPRSCSKIGYDSSFTSAARGAAEASRVLFAVFHFWIYGKNNFIHYSLVILKAFQWMDAHVIDALTPFARTLPGPGRRPPVYSISSPALLEDRQLE